jgi:hypothetical protein
MTNRKTGLTGPEGTQQFLEALLARHDTALGLWPVWKLGTCEEFKCNLKSR